MNALVTGGTKGIGFAIAEAMLAAGGNVMITGRDEGRVKQALTALTKSCAPGAQLPSVSIMPFPRTSPASTTRLVVVSVSQATRA